jgi:hypothetical protein
MGRQKDPEEEKRLCTKPTLIVRSVLLFKATSLVHQAGRGIIGAAGPIDVATVSRGNRLRDPRAFSCIWQPRLLTPRLPWKRYAHLQRVLIEPGPLADKLTFEALTPPLAGAG